MFEEIARGDRDIGYMRSSDKPDQTLITFVTKILNNSPASSTDLKEGDIINSFDGIAINTMNDLKEFIYKKKPGDTVVLQISRGKINKEISIVLGKK